jgi:nucleoside-diphosphate-sugar epimerase
MKIAIIGAGGFIGSRIVESLHLGDSPSVVALGRRAATLAGAARFAIDTRVVDALDADALAGAIGDCRSAVSTIRPAAADVKRAAAALSRAAARAQLRRVVLLSCLPPLAPEGRDSAAEGDMAAAAERQFLADCRRSGVDAYVLRAGFVYGPRSPMIDAIASDLRDECAWWPGEHDSAIDAVYVDNLIAAIRHCLKTKSLAGRSYHVRDGQPEHWQTLYHAIARELDLPTKTIQAAGLAALVAGTPGQRTGALVRRALQMAAVVRVASPAIPDFTAPVSFAEALQRSCAWWRFAHGEFEAA